MGKMNIRTKSVRIESEAEATETTPQKRDEHLQSTLLNLHYTSLFDLSLPKPASLKREMTLMDEEGHNDGKGGNKSALLGKQKSFRFEVPKARGALRVIEVSDGDVSEDSDSFERQESKTTALQTVTE